jgi:hypothetical protein
MDRPARPPAKTACKGHGGAFGLERGKIVFQPQAVMRRAVAQTLDPCRLSEEGGKRWNNNQAKKLLA